MPVANAEDLPLFPDAKKNAAKVISYINIIRENAPNPGLKGRVKPSATEETIYQMFGNGVYTLEARNAKHKVLRNKDDVKIAFEEPVESTSGAGSGGSTQTGVGLAEVKELVETVVASHSKETDRIEKIAEAGANQAREQSKQFTEMVRESTTASKETDREFFKNTNKQSQDFMSNVMAANQQNFQNMMALLQTGHTQTMQQLTAINERERNSDNPMTMVSVLLEGLKLGQGMDGDDRPEWVQGLSEGTKMLGDLTKLAMLKAGKTPAIPTPKQLAAANKADRVVKENPETNTEKTDTPPVNENLSATEINKLAALKEVLRKRGIDPEEFIEQNIEHYANASDKDIFGEDDTEDSPDKSNGNDATEPKQGESESTE
jgi:hypothetical protein